MSDGALRIAVLASGRGSNLQAVIDACEAGRISAGVAVVVSDRKDAQALERARQHGIDGVFLDPSGSRTREAFDKRIVETLGGYDVGLVVLAGYMRIITPFLIEAFPQKIINIHPSLLPSFPGLKVQDKAIEWGAKVSGCTVHFVDETVDQGPIILQAAVPVLEGDTGESLAARILEQEHRILPLAIRYIAEDRLRVEGRRVRITGGDSA